MDQHVSIHSQVSAIIRRRILPLWLAALWPLALLVLLIICMNFVTHARALTEPSMTPMEMWRSKTAASKALSIIFFVLAIYLPRDLATSGVSMIVAADQSGEALTFGSFVLRFLHVVACVVTLSAVLSHLIVFGSFFIVPGIFLAVWSAFVMPAIGTAPECAWNSARRSFRLALSRFPTLLGCELLFGLALMLGLVPLILSMVLLENMPVWWLGRVTGWSLFAILTSFVIMVRSTVLTVLYRSALRRHPHADVVTQAS